MKKPANPNSKRLSKISRDTKLAYAIPVAAPLRTYGDVLDYLKQMPAAEQAKPAWTEIRAYLEGRELATKPYTTRLIESALKKSIQ